MTTMARLRGGAGRTVALVCAALAPAAMADDLLPHRAVFDLGLASARGSGGVVDVQGRMTVEFTDVCDGWTLDQRLVLDISYDDEETYRSISAFVSWESKDGTRFRFEDRTWHDARLVEEISGEATLEAIGGRGSATLSKPKAQTIALPAGTMFPTRHTAYLIERAFAGDSYILRTMFDGTSIEGPVDIGAAMGKARAAPEQPPVPGDRTAWPMRLAFFLPDGEPDRPSFEIGVLLQANGVARGMVMDYGGYAIDAELSRFEALAPPDC